MRTINNLVLHCTATPTNTRVASIQRYWREQLGWKNPGYHFIIQRNGQVYQLLFIDKIANGVRGHNHDSIHIAYIGGIDKNGKALDNRTAAQEAAQIDLLIGLKRLFPGANILGHRDFKGVAKECPSFDVAEWLKQIKLHECL